MKIMYIKWVNSTSWHTWRSLPLENTDLVVIETVGYLIEKHKEKIVVAHSVSDSDSAVGIIAIPTACIIDKKIIE